MIFRNFCPTLSTWGDVHGERENFARNEEKRRRLEAIGERRKPWRLKSSASVESTSTTRGLRGRTSASRSCRGVPRYASLSVVLPEVADGARERGGRDRDNCAVILRLQRCQFRRLNYLSSMRLRNVRDRIAQVCNTDNTDTKFVIHKMFRCTQIAEAK